MKQSYQFSFLVTRYKDIGVWVLYNWANTENVIFDNNQHPIYKILDQYDGYPIFVPADICLDSQEYQYLIDNHFIVKNQEESRKYVERMYSDANRLSDLHLILMVANQACNFNCVYCYEDHNQKHRMGEIDHDIIMKYITKNNLDRIGVDYFGGEPMLNYKFICKLNKSIIKYTKNTNILFSSAMTTNGYLLTKDKFLNLVGLRVSNYQITVDGIKEDHDRLRPLSNGDGTFERILNNLVDISNINKNVDFTIILRINFYKDTATKYKRREFLSFIREKIKCDERFIINPHIIMDWKKCGESTQDIYTHPEHSAQIENNYKNDVIKSKLTPFDMVNLSGLESNSCYADKINSCVVFPTELSDTKDKMNVLKCTVGLDDDINNVGYISRDGILVNNSNLCKWVGMSPFKKDDCKSCFFVLNCYGSSCPLNNIKNGYIKCPPEKYREIDMVKGVMDYISNN